MTQDKFQISLRNRIDKIDKELDEIVAKNRELMATRRALIEARDDYEAMLAHTPRTGG